MRKIKFIVLAIAAGMAIVSCKNEAPNGQQTNQPAENVKSDSTAAAGSTLSAIKEAASNSKSPTANLKTLTEIVAKAKTDGATWSVDQWKMVFTDFAIVYKPIALKMESLLKMMQDTTKIMDAIVELKKYEAEYKEFDKAFDEFSKIAEGSENGKKMIKDEQWLKKTMDDLGIPDL